MRVIPTWGGNGGNYLPYPDTLKIVAGFVRNLWSEYWKYSIYFIFTYLEYFRISLRLSTSAKKTFGFFGSL